MHVTLFVVQYVLDGVSLHSCRFSNSGWIQTLVQRKPHLALQTNVMHTNVFSHIFYSSLDAFLK